MGHTRCHDGSKGSVTVVSAALKPALDIMLINVERSTMIAADLSSHSVKNVIGTVKAYASKKSRYNTPSCLPFT
jgi:hypothetical protein